ncbi:Polyadenylate-binding protein-interacting protein 7 [Hibiscus syriacus]|uniref:Polyadenylate-binding protein-interacting protein 7 n=1 Tax=Hibiscus syriacus TaxID=106335 RepID=A0A6A3BBX2_HIBSY|nr:polyadenylate-binding protein-interacting protein 7-like [Hibiscus syriacus]KAE8714053.1 Polyadenylate-binding protein-interacting protein 7 [Hibiscus syriacus]
MSLSKKGTQISDTKLNTPSKVTTLNPNAAEFVPFSLRSLSSSGSIQAAAATATFATTGTVGKAVLDRSGSSVSNNSDDEAHQFWRHQLPDDITPDFKVINEDDAQGNESGSLYIEGLSLHDGSKASRFPAGSGYVFDDQQELLHHYGNGSNRAENLRYPASSYGEDPISASILNLPLKPWDKQLVNSNQPIGNGREGQPYNGNSRHVFVNDILGEQTNMDDTEMSHVDFLASQFPGFAAESLAEVYFANGCDLNLTIEMLTQLELQVDGGFNQNLNSKTLSAPSLSTMDIPALTVSDDQSGPSKYAGDDLQHNASPYRSSDKAFTELLVGEIYSLCTFICFNVIELAANLYSELREEARDHARLRNAYFEQARQAFLIGNKTLAKELSVKGQMYNMHMKEAHGKAQESIYQHRNPVPLENFRGQERMIDLHGLHVSEALHMLKHELSVLRGTARAAAQLLQVYICVGTGHHTRGARNPARLPVAVQRYLLEEEGLDYTEPQPGLLRVVIY